MSFALASPAARFTAQRLASILFVASIVLLFSVSSLALGFIGVNYDSVGGSLWQKLHPATYLMALAFAAELAGKSKPFGFIRGLAERLPGAALFFFSWLLLIAYAALVQHAPIAAPIETYFIGFVALLMHDDLRTDTRQFLRRFIHLILFVNAVIGVFEFLTHIRLFPYVIAGEDLTGDYRSTALLGHPLQNAATSAAYMLCLFFGADEALTPIVRAFLIGVQIFGLAAFGGRTSILMSGLIVSGFFLKDFALILLGRKFDIGRLILLMFIAPVVTGAVAYTIALGVFDDLIGRFIDDNGSAEARIIMMKMFDAFDIADLLMGPDPQLVSSTQRTLGIAVGIENTWVAMIFQYGAIMTLFFVVGLFALLWELWRQARPRAVFLFVFFIVIVSSATGLASKTTMFDHFAILLLFMFSNDSPPARKPPSIGGVPGDRNCKAREGEISSNILS